MEKYKEIERTWLIDPKDMPNFVNGGTLFWWNTDKCMRYWTKMDDLTEIRYTYKVLRDWKIDRKKILSQPKGQYTNSFRLTKYYKENEPKFVYEYMLKKNNPNDAMDRTEFVKTATKQDFDSARKFAIAADICICKQLNVILSDIDFDIGEDGEFSYKAYPNYDLYMDLLGNNFRNRIEKTGSDILDVAKKDYAHIGANSFLFNYRLFPDGHKVYMVELEFDNMLAASKFKAPKLFGKEVTDDETYRGKLLAKKHFNIRPTPKLYSESMY